MSFCIKVENALRRLFTGETNAPVHEVSFFMGDNINPLEAIYHISYRDAASGKRIQGKLPWAILNAWHGCSRWVDAPTFKELPYDTRRAWSNKVAEILLGRAAELDVIVARQIPEPTDLERAGGMK